MAADDGQLKLRLPHALKTTIEERAQRNHRTINGEVLFLLEQAINHTYSQHDVRVINMRNGYKRLIYGKLINQIDVDYTQDLSQLKTDIELALETLRRTSLKHKISFLTKDVLVNQGGHHIDVVDNGKGSLDWIVIEDHFSPVNEDD